MKVLLIGGGGREHSLGWKIAQSPILTKLYIDASNPGLNHIGAPVAIDLTSPEAITSFAQQNHVDLVVVGPEAPLAGGVGDQLRAAGIACFGPDKASARLETSKAFMKEVCASAAAPTAAYGKFTDIEPAKRFLRSQTAPYVIKADGLAAGKGVVIADTLDKADKAVEDMLSGQFGEASAEIVIEEFMEGEEASFFAITDGKTILPMIAAQDHKRVGEGDTGPNTGGMGAYSPAPVFTSTVRQRTIDTIIQPIVSEMEQRGTPYIGVIYAGLMIKDEMPRLVEINARFGDPECQILMRRLDCDLLPILHAAAIGTLNEHSFAWHDDAAALIVMAANGYPGNYKKGSPITGIENANAKSDVIVFHAGTEEKAGQFYSKGGRVLNITATGETVGAAIRRAYEAVDEITFPEGFCRRDIGWRALGREI